MNLRSNLLNALTIITREAYFEAEKSTRFEGFLYSKTSLCKVTELVTEIVNV